MNERAPKLSIGLPVYNGEKYLPDALDDLLGQDYEDFELIISSNASTDGTDEICREYASKDRRVSHSRNDCNIGATPNWNRVANSPTASSSNGPCTMTNAIEPSSTGDG